MQWRLTAFFLLCAGCGSSPGPYAPAPGSELVFELANSFGVARSPLWCRAPVGGAQSCVRLLPDSSQAGLEWDAWHRPYQFTLTWNRIPAIRAFDLRDSLRRELVSRGARQIGGAPRLPNDSAHHLHTQGTKWCLDSAVVMLVSSWQEGSSFEFVNLGVGAVPDRDCSTDMFRALHRPHEDIRPGYWLRGRG